MKKSWLGILILLLAFTMTVIGCNEDEINLLDYFHYNTTIPPSVRLEAVGINLEQYNLITEAPNGGYRGWWTDETGDIEMIWTDRSQTDADDAEAVLHSIGGLDFDFGYVSERTSVNGYYIPARTLVVVLLVL